MFYSFIPFNKLSIYIYIQYKHMIHMIIHSVFTDSLMHTTHPNHSTLYKSPRQKVVMTRPTRSPIPPIAASCYRDFLLWKYFQRRWRRKRHQRQRKRLPHHFMKDAKRMPSLFMVQSHVASRRDPSMKEAKKEAAYCNIANFTNRISYDMIYVDPYCEYCAPVISNPFRP